MFLQNVWQQFDLLRGAFLGGHKYILVIVKITIVVVEEIFVDRLFNKPKLK